jgi:sialic acid synthase SpsE
VGISIFSSVFDNSAVDFLENLNTPAYKIASFEAIDIPLIKYAASTGKPMIISTGLADQEEISEAIDAARSAGCCNLAILHCVSGYPAPISDYNLRTIVDMKERFGVVTGLSDHTISNTTALAGVALGASIVEKHITLDRQGGGPDDSFSLESDDLERLCCEAKTTWQALGSVDYGLKSSEIGNVKFRRSLYFVRALKAGMKITQGDIRSVRPGYGAAPKHYDSIIGKVVKHSVVENTPVELSNLI